MGIVGDGDGEGVDESELSSGLNVGSAGVARLRFPDALLPSVIVGIGSEDGVEDGSVEDEDKDMNIEGRSG